MCVYAIDTCKTNNYIVFPFCRQLIIETYSQLPHFVRSEVVTTANIVSNDVINQPALATPSEIDNLKSNEAYTMVMTCSTNPSYTVVKPTREEN